MKLTFRLSTLFSLVTGACVLLGSLSILDYLHRMQESRGQTRGELSKCPAYVMMTLPQAGRQFVVYWRPLGDMYAARFQLDEHLFDEWANAIGMQCTELNGYPTFAFNVWIDDSKALTSMHVLERGRFGIVKIHRGDLCAYYDRSRGEVVMRYCGAR